MSERLTEEEKVALGCGAILGIIGTTICAIVINYAIGQTFTSAKVFKNESGKPSVMRLYREGADQILVGASESGEAYLTLEKYLRDIKDTAERNIEQAKIEKLVGWYEN